MTDTATIPTILDQKEVIRLEKNTKGYNWEIKIIIDKLDDVTALKRIDILNEMLKKSYGDKE